MASRFSRGSKAYAKDGRAYTVDLVEDGMVYCSSANGTETEFPEASLLNEADWAARSDGRRDAAYARVRQSRAFTTPTVKLDRAAASKFLDQAERLAPGLLDFVAFTAASQIISENKELDLLAGLSIIKCRNIFDGVFPEVRASLLATVLGIRPDLLMSAASLGDNMARAMVEKGLAAHAEAFEAFGDRPRR